MTTTSDTYFIGADIGTTGCRVCIFGTGGDLASQATATYPLHVPQAGWAEQDPTVIVEAFERTLAEAIRDFPHPRERLRALALSTVLHSLFPVNADGRPLGPMLTWADTRAQPFTDVIRQRTDADAFYARTGCPLHPMYPVAKLLWWRDADSSLFASAHKFISIKELLVHRLTGRFLVDRSIASGTGLYNNRTLDWDAEALSLTGLRRDQLSDVLATTATIDGWSPAKAGLPDGVSLVIGASDGVLSTLGAGAVGPGEFTAMIGTSGAVRVCDPEPKTDPAVRNWCYNLTDDLWVLGGAINNGGLALDWVRQALAAGENAPEDYNDLVEDAVNGAPPGSEGLVFLPLLTGERSPYYNGHARGVMFGLTLNHRRPHLVRATLEGVVYAMHAVFSSLQRLGVAGGTVRDVRASGSFMRSPAWVQIMADVFGHAVTVPGEPEGAAFGAAALGMIAAGAIDGPAAVGALIGAARGVYEPDPARHAVYAPLFALYERVYGRLVDEFDAIAALQAHD
jgi:gluconokinase